MIPPSPPEEPQPHPCLGCGVSLDLLCLGNLCQDCQADEEITYVSPRRPPTLSDFDVEDSDPPG